MFLVSQVLFLDIQNKLLKIYRTQPLITIWIFFQRSTFLTNTCPETKEKKLFCKIHKKTPVLESLFNKVTDLYPATLTQDSPTGVFWWVSARYLRHLFYRTPPGDSFCSTEKYFTNKIVKNPLRKEKNWKHFVRKTTTHTEQKFNYYLHQVSYPFTI